MLGEAETVLPASQEMSDEASATEVGETFSEERETPTEWEAVIRQAIAESGTPGSAEFILGLERGRTTRLTQNGKKTDRITVGQGVRQGDPLSCWLFNA